MRNHRYRWLLPAAIAALSIAAGCGEEDSGSGDSGSERASGGKIKIGLNVELSGPGSFFGNSRLIGATAAVNEVNKNGGVEVDGETYELELVPCDNETDPTKGVQCAQEGVDEGVIWTAAPDLGFEAAYEIYRENDILSLANGGTAGALLTEDADAHPTLFFEFLTYQQTVEAGLIKIRELYPELKTIAGMVPDDENGRTFDEAFQEYAPEHGFEYLGSEFFPPDAEGDFTSYLTSMKSKGAELLYLSYYPQVAIPSAEQAAGLDAGEVYWSELLLPSDFEGVDFSPKPMISTQSAWSFAPPDIVPEEDPGATGAEEVIAAMEKEAGGEPFLSAIASQAYVSDVQIPIAAIEAAGSLNAEDIAAEMLNATYDGPLGPAEVTENHSVDLAQPAVLWDSEGQVSVNVYNSGFDTEPAYTIDVPSGGN